MPLRDFALLLLVCAIWSMHTIVAKLVVSGMEIPPLFYAAARYAVVAVVAAPWLFPIPRPLWRIVLVGLLMGGGGFAMFFIGMKTSSPSGSAVVQQLGMPMTALLSVLILGERIPPRRFLGIVLAFIGAVIVMLDPHGFSLSTGLVFIAGSAFAGSLGAVVMKQTSGVRPLQFQAWVGLASSLPLIGLTALVETGQMSAAANAGVPFIAAVLFSALIVSVVSHTIYYGLIQRHEANLVAPLMLMNPLITVALGIVVTGDTFDIRMAVGTAVALSGVLLITLNRRHLEPFAALLRR